MDEQTFCNILTQCYQESFLNPSHFIKEVRETCTFPALKSLALSFCISTSELYDSAHECEYSYSWLFSPQSEKSFSREQQVSRSNKRLHNLIAVLRSGSELPASDSPKSVLSEEFCSFFDPKVFDKELENAMLTSFNSTAETFGIPRIFSNKDLLRSDTSISDEDKAHLIQAQLFLDIQSLPRNAFSFVEYAVLCCLYLSIHHKSLHAINRAYTNSKQKYQTKLRFQRISNTLFSPDYRAAIIRTIFDRLYNHGAAQANELREGHCREFWLDEKHRELTHINYAMERYALKSPEVPSRYSSHNDPKVRQGICDAANKDCESFQIDKVTAYPCINPFSDDSISYGSEELNQKVIRFGDQANILQTYESFCNVICPVAELIVFGHLSPEISVVDRTIDILPYVNFSTSPSRISDALKRNSSYEIFSIEYKAACDLASLVTTYFSKTHQAVAQLLACLPEASIANGQDFYDYLASLYTPEEKAGD